jgi:carboxypeptidase family protein
MSGNKGMKISTGVSGLLLIALLAVPALAKKKHEDPLATLNFLVVRDENGKPVRNAAVVMHPVEENGKQSKGGLELKTDPDGKASYDGVPYGKLRIQVLAPGFQTFGDDYDVNQESMEITIKLKRPTGQYSVYEQHPSDRKPDEQKPDEAKPQ